MGKVLFMRKGETHTEPKPGLPSGYTKLAYIQSTGTQYNDMGISVPHASSRVVIEFAPMEVSADNPISGYAYPTWSWDTNLAFVSGSKILVANTYGPVVANGVFYKFEYTSTYYRINDGEKVAMTNRSYVDGYNNTVSFAGGKYGKNKIRHYQLYNGDTLVRDCVPCINPSGTVGLFDMVERKFYGNSGTGVFIGSEVA